MIESRVIESHEFGTSVVPVLIPTTRPDQGDRPDPVASSADPISAATHVACAPRATYADRS